ncbi:MAG: hypothetical protein A2W80_00925 [Candidatus Riflebacteria bacterium GWC2_50_8]|nr:MAG: hypothetical protein A2W80_00925 [Candidatus Riflebacteria bacterium GWC2_50_8]
METKLTLRLNRDIIEKAREYAQQHKISLSRMVEAYFSALTSGNRPEKDEITPLVKSLSGVINLANDFDYQTDIAEQAGKKHK